VKFLAKGQQSTDLNLPEKQGLSGFGCPIASQPPSRTVTASLGWDRRPLPQLERDPDAQPPVKDPASTRRTEIPKG
jgi:hypothetical protein